ncbi:MULTISPECIES: RNA-binding S4 domain-containing protein [Deferrisoma]
MKQISITTEWIRLDQALKSADWVQTGGEAKIRIQAGEVRVNGEVETRRGRKLRPGDRVEWQGRLSEIAAAAGGAGEE